MEEQLESEYVVPHPNTLDKSLPVPRGIIPTAGSTSIY